LSPRRMQLGYFQVMAEPVSTWVHEILERSPRQSPPALNVVEKKKNDAHCGER